MSLPPVVYVVDDDPSVAAALERLFRVAGYRLVAFTTAGELLLQAELASPACLVLDVHLPDLNGLEIQRELQHRGWTLPIVFITGHGTVPQAVEAMRAGAVHFLGKPFDNQELLAAVRQALDRENDEFARREEGTRLKLLVDSLTPREQQVLLLVAAGLANKNIAARLGVSLQTVKLHRGRLMEKLQFDSVAQLVQFADRARASLPDPTSPA